MINHLIITCITGSGYSLESPERPDNNFCDDQEYETTILKVA